VGLDSFVKKITFEEITPGGIKQLGKTLCTMAEGEQLEAHRRAVTVRLDTL
jgi:histidinol dehydrogenase